MTSEVDEIEVSQPPTGECGFFCIKLPWLQKLAKFSLLFLCLIIVNVCCSMLGSYHNAMVSTFEKRFDWQTSTVGFILSANDYGYLSSVLFTAYFGGMTNRVKLIAFCSMFYGFSGVMYAFPYFLYGSKYTKNEVFATQTERISNIPMCKDNTTSSIILQGISDERESDLTFQSHVSFVVFMLAGIVQGVATGPFWNVAFALIDDMTKQWAGVFIGLYTLLRAIGPVLGYILASKITYLNENLSGVLVDFQGGQKHPLWIGAWWLGYLVLGILVMVVALPLLLFPSYIAMDTKIKPENVKNPILACIVKQSNLTDDILVQEEQSNKNARKKDKSIVGFFKALMRLFSSTIFLSLVLGNFFEFIALSNLVNYKAKYLENHFDISQSEASFFTAFASPLPFLLGLMLSIFISFKFQMSMYSLARFHAFVHLFAIVNYTIGLSITCPTPNILMSNSTTQLSAHCGGDDCFSCTETRYYPVCGGLNQTFYSPCVAGCSSSLQNCTCSTTGSVRFGTCGGACYTNLILYVFIGTSLGMLQCSARTQEAVINLRCVQPRDKALALAISSFIWGLVSSILPPIIGSIFDSFCLMKSDSQKKRSYCQLYNRDSFRTAFHLLPIIAQSCAVVCFFMVWYFTAKKYGREECVLKKEDEQVSLTEKPNIQKMAHLKFDEDEEEDEIFVKDGKA